MPLDVQSPLTPAKLITDHEAPTACPFCSAPRSAIQETLVAFACFTTAVFPRQLPGEHRNPKVKQTLKCIALAKAGGWKRAAA